MACFSNNNISQEILQEDYLRSLQHIAVSKDVMNFCVSDIEKLVKYAQLSKSPKSKFKCPFEYYC